jgi:hypothetical protein
MPMNPTEEEQQALDRRARRQGRDHEVTALYVIILVQAIVILLNLATDLVPLVIQ